MRGKMLLVSAVIALVAFSGVLLAMTSEEISKLPLKERMKYEEEMRLSERVNQTDLTVERVERIIPSTVPVRAVKFDYVIEWVLDCSPQTNVALGPGVVDDTLLWVTAGGIENSGDDNWVFIYNLNTMACVDSFLQPTTSTWGWRDLAYDGTYLYASDGTGVDKIDPATHSVIGTIYPASGLSVHRALACDGDSMWAANWASSIWKFATDGSNAHSYFNDQSLYGLAYDPAGFIWGSAQEGDDGNTVVKYDAVDLTVIEAVEIPEVGLAGGCEFYNDSLLLYVDQNENDVFAIRMHFYTYDHDVALNRIIEPSGTYWANEMVTPKVGVKNWGANDETFDVTIGWGGAKYSETQTDIFLAAGESDTVEFTPFITDVGTYPVTAYIALTGDENPGNDTLTGEFTVVTWLESFEGDFPPEGWLVVNNDGGSQTWGQYSSESHTGDYSASVRWESSSLRNDDWLITPKLVCEAGVEDNIDFWYMTTASTYPESLEVWLSTTGSDVTDFTEQLYAGPCPRDWGEMVINLDAYDGNNVYVAFVYRCLDYLRVCVDDVSGPPFWLPEYDVGVTLIITPEGLVPEGDVYPQVEVKNFGANEATFPVTFQIWSGTKQDYESTVDVTLGAGLTETVDFTDPFTAVAGSYTTLAYTGLAGDEEPFNDSLSGSFMVPSYIEDFDTSDGGFSALLDGGLVGWQWGIPTDPDGPDAAHSGVNLWGTNLAGDYDNNADFSLKKEFIALSDNPALLFYHWYNTENRFDGGNVKLSTDFGASWTVISPVDGYDAVGYSACEYESLFTGHNQGYWEFETFDLSSYVNTGDVFSIRWHFRSDGSVGNYPGWFVDDVAGLGFIPFIPSHDVGVSEIVSPTGVIYDGDVVTPEVVVENFGPVPDTVDVTLDFSPPVLKSRQVYHEVVTAVVDAETTLVVTFPEWTAIAGTYDVTAYTTLVGDEVPGNDTLTTSLIVGSWVEDFEGPPLYWEDYQLGDANNGWQQFYAGAPGSHGDPMGNYSAWHDDDNVATGCDDWLVTPAYSVEPNAQLYFYHRNYYSPEDHKLCISTGSGVPPVDFVELQDLTDVTASDWTVYGPVDLSAYAGSQIYLAWVYRGDYDDEWYLDDVIGINLSHMIPYDVAVVGVPNEAVGDTIPQGSLLHPSCVVTNNSPVASGLELSFRVHYKIQKDGNLYWHRVYDVMNLPASAEETIYFPGDVVLNEPGDYTITVTIQTGFIDPILANNTSVRYIHVTSGKGGAQVLPRVFAIHQNAPNPARANTSICYAIPRTSDVSIRVFDVSGRVVRTLVEATKEPGYYTENWDLRDDRGREIASGIYFYELNAGNFKSVKKMVVMR